MESRMPRKDRIRVRCAWVGEKPLMIAYHDQEWGVPIHDEIRLFEFLILEGAQAGLSWMTVLSKREHYRIALDGFDPEKVARYGQGKVGRLLADPGLIRNRLKIEAAIENARRFLEIQQLFGSFDAYVWSFVGGRTLRKGVRSRAEVPSSTPESDSMSRDLKARGFRFVGSTICYAFMQAVGMVNDHQRNCFRYAQL
jgi:DNA-3-methyladenine glycosylase I